MSLISSYHNQMKKISFAWIAITEKLYNKMIKGKKKKYP